jgi:hypothetical protein
MAKPTAVQEEAGGLGSEGAQRAARCHLGCSEGRLAGSAIRGQHFDLDLGFGDLLLDERPGGVVVIDQFAKWTHGFGPDYSRKAGTGGGAVVQRIEFDVHV